ncbi:ABC transporter ATP-binding protein [Salinibius halmophilus]|uniref:ABC transporter ATP-binding protein n=1 Tax=Salinibius halmophilus TaxID=1853216 RepID=UPI000E664761|nr:ABC transporter ATP-binding protein [Salinibius halmophilus]
MINVEGLAFTYAKQHKPTLSNLSFSVADGEIFGFLGPSGSGKSTTQKLLTGMLAGHQGKAELLGKPIEAWKSEVYQHIGVGFELPNHYEKLTARENLKVFAGLQGIKNAKPRIEEVLEQVGLLAHADQRTQEFSKGMRVRLNFARAVLHKPKLLFLDEPTSGLDPVNAKIVKDLILAERNAGATIFLTTHNMFDADALCDRVAFIVEGQLRHIGQPWAIKQEYGQARIELTQLYNGETIKNDYPLDNLATNQSFLTQLGQAPIQALHSQEATLEQAFIQLTGKTLGG